MCVCVYGLCRPGVNSNTHSREHISDTTTSQPATICDVARQMSMGAQLHKFIENIFAHWCVYVCESVHEKELITCGDRECVVHSGASEML